MARPASPARSAAAERRRRAALLRRRAALRRRWGIGFASAGVVVTMLAVGAFAAARIADADPCRRVPAEYSAAQRANAETIIQAGRDAGLPQRDQTIAVMTAMGESSLRNLDYGDWETSGITNPDGSRTTSIGLFQQQDNWGTRDERLDPYTAATLFYRAMVARVPEPARSTLEPTLVAHRTQVNRDPQHYADYWEPAVDLVDVLGGTCA